LWDASGEKRVAVFVAYSDETEVNRQDDSFLMGGYVSNEEDWPWMAHAWQERVLDGPPIIPYLHMREIRNHNWRAQHGISYNAAEERIDEAARVMQSFGNLAAIASRIRRSQVNSIFNKPGRKKRHIPKGIDEPDYFCFVSYAALILGQVQKKWPSADRVNFVISRKKGVSDYISTIREHIYDFLCRHEEYRGLGSLLGDVIPASMEHMLPLQSADVLMWHIQRYYAAGKQQKNMHPCDAVRTAKLTHDGQLDGTVHEWERSDLEQMAEIWARAGLLVA
jgi:hypothetical protein